MNVLNKLKSKKNKQPLRITEEEQSQPPRPPSPKRQEQKALSVRESSNFFFEKKQEVVPRKKAQMVMDEDDVTVSDYFSKKDKQKKSIMSRSFTGDEYRQSYYQQFMRLNVKKAYTIGGICLFQGEIVVHKKIHKKMSVSCSAQAVSFPESIAKIVLNRVTFINEEEAVFVGEDILKIVEKGHNTKK